MIHAEFCCSVLGAGPRFGHEATDGQPPLIEQRYQDEDPAVAKDTDQAPGCRSTRAVWRPELGRPRRQRAHWDPFLCCAADAEPPPGCDRHRQPQAGSPLGIGHAGALPLPPGPFGELEALFDPGAQPLPTGLARGGSQLGQQQPRIGVAGLPPCQQGAIEPPARALKGRAASCPLRAGLRD